MAPNRDDMNIKKLTQISVKRFSFFMKCIAENDLWDEAELRLEELGCTEIRVSSEPIAAVQELLKRKADEGEQLSARGRRVAECVCGGHPVNNGDAGGNGDAGPPPNQA
jgi:hypothetical protein